MRPVQLASPIPIQIPERMHCANELRHPNLSVITLLAGWACCLRVFFFWCRATNKRYVQYCRALLRAATLD